MLVITQKWPANSAVGGAAEYTDRISRERNTLSMSNLDMTVNILMVRLQ